VPQLLPFRGIRYTSSAGAIPALLAPPFDVISPAQQRELEGRSPYNAVRLELAHGGDERYASVATLVAEWQDAGALARDDVPMLYLYEQEFSERGHTHRRRGLIAEVEAQPWDEGAVRPHEFTLSAAKEDRLKLLEATSIQFSPVFMLARDRAGQLRQFLEETMASRPPDIEAATPEGDTHRLWLVEAGRLEMRRLAPLLSESFMIADGHHRYETAVDYRDRRLASETLERDHPARFVMAAVVPVDDPGLVVRPIHRVVPRRPPDDWYGRLSDHFYIEPFTGAVDPDTVADLLHDHRGCYIAAGLEPGMAHWLVPLDRAAVAGLAPAGHSEAWAGLDYNVLRYGVLNPLWDFSEADLAAGAVEYTHLPAEALERAASGAVAFLVNPVPVQDVIALAEAGERMPQKSTFFYPKLGTGLVFHPLYP
jgi:uncharacterized protein (DUF1015 family)